MLSQREPAADPSSKTVAPAAKAGQRPNDIVEAILGLAVCIGLVVYLSQPGVTLAVWQHGLAFIGFAAGVGAVVRYLSRSRRKTRP